MQKLSLQKDPFFIKMVFILVFFTITPLALFASVLSLVALTNTRAQEISRNSNILNTPKPGVQVYASLPSDFPSVSGEIVEADARPELIRNYLETNNSALAPYSQILVETADEYGLDYRLLTAIAQKESGLCKVIPEGSHNCWGWGIHSAGTLKFSSYEEGIETVSRGLREFYLDQGYVTVEEIMKKYAHPSSTTWAEGVSLYMKQIQ